MLKLRYALGLLFLGIAAMTSDDASAQPAGFNYDEAKVPQYELPDPLTTNDGRPVSSAEMWTQ
ncbi:MAG: hypothetical protein KDA47_24810, partial [Planctomycetales bacterium]|nr:hypothetical protein [Planctomycetales bacterium]